MPLMASLPCGFIAHWTVWPGQHRDTALMSFVLYYSLPPCSSHVPFLVNQNIVDNKFHCQQREQCFQFLFLFFFNVVEGCCQSWNFITYSESLPDVSFLELCMLGWCRLSQGSGFSTVADHLEPQAADRSLLADKSAAQHN